MGHDALLRHSFQPLGQPFVEPGDDRLRSPVTGVKRGDDLVLPPLSMLQMLAQDRARVVDGPAVRR